MSRRSRLEVRPRLERLDDRCVLSAVTPAQLNSAYGLNAITFSNGTVKGTGEGQTIAIIDAYNDPTIYSDLTAFDAKYGIANPTLTSTPSTNSATSTAAPSFTVVNQSSSSDSGWDTETALDVEMAHAAAPGANIVLISAASASTSDLLAAVNSAKTIPSVSVISMSWGGSEFYGEQSYDSIFTTPSGHTGITFVASAGDSGAGAEWPAASPNVVAVGGTSLVVTSSTTSSQVAWSSSGGGASQVEAKPSYQANVPGTTRSTPDVSLDADPNTGVVIVSQGQQTQVGGTSLAAPVFGGLIAIADQGRAVVGKSSLDGATQTLPGLYASTAGSFTDVTTGARATVGYDTATGLGTPNATTLVASLAGVPTTTTTSTTTTTGTTTTGTGTTGTGTGTTGTGGTTTGGTPTAPSGGRGGRGRWGFFTASNGSSNWWSGYLTREAVTTDSFGSVPNLVAAKSPTIFTNPEATDAALESWGEF